MRIACLLIPDLPLQAELRASPELKGEALAITSGPGARAEILAVSQEAARRSVQPGQTLPQARAVCPEIEVRIASPILERTAREAMLDVALSLAPRAELAPRASGLFASEGAVYVDASGIESLHANERSFASILHARAERAGLRGLVSLASSRGVAHLAARHLHFTQHLDALSLTRSDRPRPQKAGEAPETIRILPADRELEFLAPLPIDLLDPDDRTAQALTRFGLHRIRDLLRLSRRDLAARLGPELLELVARARGEAAEPPLPEPRTTALEEGEDLDVAIGSLEPLSFVLRGLVSRLAERLSLRGLGATGLRLDLQLEGGARTSLRVGVASPCQEDRVLLRLLRLAVENAPPAAPIEGVRLLCDGVPLRREQLDLFLPRGPSPSALDQTLAELGSICGSDRVGSPAVADDHNPDAFILKPFRRPKPRPTIRGTGSASPASARRAQRAGPRLTIRAIRPPLRAEVRLERGRPVHVRSALGRGPVLRVAGPFRVTGHWWSKAAHFAIDHYDIQMNDGTLLRLRFDWRAKRWQIDGLYD